MKWIAILLLSVWPLLAVELKVIADAFKADESSGLSEFLGNVQITKGADEMNASKVSIYIDNKRRPIKYVAEGNLSFLIHTDTNATYSGSANRGVFMPDEQLYEFYGEVNLWQLDQKKAIVGDKVIVNMLKGTATAEGGDKKPVIMIFELDERR